MRLAHLNMTDPSSQCPVGFRVEAANEKMFCIRDTSSAGCGSMHLDSPTHKCMDMFVDTRTIHQMHLMYKVYCSSNEPLYVDGVSITYGTPPTHIWTYVAGYLETGSDAYNCLCTHTHLN